MHIKKIRTVNFRNLDNSEIQFSSGLNIIYGDNGQGKTNLLEAIFILSGGRSFRGAENQELIKLNSEQSSVEGEVSGEISNHLLEVQIAKTKKFIKDSQPSAVSDFYGTFVCVSFTPSDLSLVQGAPVVRRRLLDRHCADLNPAFLNPLFEYNRALRNKNLLLKEGAEADKIRAWNEIIINRGLNITSQRLELVKQLQEKANEIYARYALSDGLLELSLKSDFVRTEELTSAEQIRNNLENILERERHIKKSALGIQRDDLIIKFGGKSAASFASQGQGKSMALALKLALVDLIAERREISPVLILDDLDSELDQARNFKIRELLFSGKRQIFISGTGINYAKSDAPDIKVLKLQDGRVSD